MYNIANVYKQNNLYLAFDRLIFNPESTYKNYFRNTYSAYALSLKSNIESLQKKMKSGYLPSPTIRSFLPKSNGLSRMYTLMSIEDQIVYQSYANIIALSLYSNVTIRGRYKKRVFGNLLSKPNDSSFYQKWQDSYKAFTKEIIKAHDKGNKYIASFDLTACYDSINHNLLRNTLINKYRFSENCASTFIQLLEKWESSDNYNLGTGIPQGPQASGAIAELILTEYDSYIESLQEKLSFEYFRYVDDIKILSTDEKVIKWVLFLLDVKSKELGLFPQSSKITIHKITDINLEVKRISKPLFDEEFDDETKNRIALSSIKTLIKKEPYDVTTIKRYFQYVKQDKSSNKIAIQIVNKIPNMIHSFAFYLQRYPRKIPKSISDFIYMCCCDKTQQFSAGILLESVIDNLQNADIFRFLELSKKILNEDKKNNFIIDPRFKSQLLTLQIIYNKKINKVYRRYISNCNWWITAKLIYQLNKYELIDKIGVDFINKCLSNDICDVSIAASSCFFLTTKALVLPKTNTMSEYSQNLLKECGIIQKKRYSNSQINRFLKELTGFQCKFPWRKKLASNHNIIEKRFYCALTYWNTDLTAFVNLWDEIDDSLCNILFNSHPELGTYTLGKIGSVTGSKKFKEQIPQFNKMCDEIHKLRGSSQLSHFVIKKDGNITGYTGPIPQQKRKFILSLITNGFQEIVDFW